MGKQHDVAFLDGRLSLQNLMRERLIKAATIDVSGELIS
jgi:hypothetical protein